MTNLDILVNYVDSTVDYQTTPADYIEIDTVLDYIIWTEGDTTVKDLMLTEPTAQQLQVASSVISADEDKTVAKCLLMDYSHNIGGAYYTHLVKGMAENKRYVFCFSFDNATATEPQLEAWDDSTHTTYAKNVLGASTPADSMIKAVCTTDALPGEAWAGVAIAGDGVGRVLLLNNGNGALPVLATGETSQELYANIKIVIPMAFADPDAETFVLCTRFTWN